MKDNQFFEIVMRDGHKREVIDYAKDYKEAKYMLQEYRLAFHCVILIGQKVNL